MNLVDMARRKDRHLRLQAKLVSTGTEKWRLARELASYVTGNFIIATKRPVAGTLYRGFDMSADERTRLIVESPLAWYPFRRNTNITGWKIVAIDRNVEGRTLEIRLKDRSAGTIFAAMAVTITDTLQAIEFPIPDGPCTNLQQSDLELSFSGRKGGRAFLAVHRVMDRQELLAYCLGKGVELGPGLHPQILPDPSRDVLYVEQSSPEQWDRLYNEKDLLTVNKSLWNRYTIGEAFPLPVDNGSLDFIFSSHVFEHLANPLGYLEHWRTKLRQGGVVACVVPDVGGSKDYVFEPCLMRDLLAEYAAHDMEPNIQHYQRWAAYRAPGKDPMDYLKARRSIHAHFYTNDNITDVLTHAVTHLGYSWFRVWHTPNHKDFYFVIRR